ncbi:MAG: nuclear transport factor 2 family protein [Pseudomonadota bacterium]
MTKAKVLIATVAASLSGAAYAKTDVSSTVSNTAAISEAAAVVSRYVVARRADLLDPVWTGRRMENGALISIGREHAKDMPAIAQNAALTSLQVFADDFAIARIDDWEKPGVTILTLFKSNGAWRVAGESMASAACGVREKRFNPSTAASAVLATLNAYYTGVDQDNPALLETAHHESWLMKNHENGEVAAEPKDIFAARLSNGKHNGYADDRQVADIQIIYDCMAYIRIDKPSSLGTTVFTFYREDGAWKIVDKAWSSQK